MSVDTDLVRESFVEYQSEEPPGLEYIPMLKSDAEEQFDRWLAEERAKVWLEALQHVQRLSDPAYTVSLPPGREIITLPDVYQAMAENPYRTGETNEN